MIGWLFLALLGGAAALAVRVGGVRGSPLTLVFAAIMLGAAGYALQGKPGLAGAPVAAVSKAADQNPPDLLRNAMYGTFNADSGYVIAADAMRRSGDERAAVRVLIGGLNRLPQSYILWTERGGALDALLSGENSSFGIDGPLVEDDGDLPGDVPLPVARPRIDRPKVLEPEADRDPGDPPYDCAAWRDHRPCRYGTAYCLDIPTGPIPTPHVVAPYTSRPRDEALRRIVIV